MKSDLKHFSGHEIQEKVLNSINKLFDEDIFLLKADANERSISHKLAIYLQAEFESFKELSVDCEYNRDMDFDPKRIDNWKSKCAKKVESDDVDAKTVYPDIIVHERGNNDNNLLVIEIKKSNNPDNGCDQEKIKNFIKDLKYDFGVFINIGVKDNARKFCLKGFPLEKFTEGYENEC